MPNRRGKPRNLSNDSIRVSKSSGDVKLFAKYNNKWHSTNLSDNFKVINQHVNPTRNGIISHNSKNEGFVNMKITADSSSDPILKLLYDSTNYASITTAANGATTIATIDSDGTSGNLTFNPDGAIISSTHHTANLGISTKNGATGAGYVDFYEDSDNGSNKITLAGQASTGDITVTLPSTAGTIRTVEKTPLVISYPFYFNDTTASRTYFRDTDDPNDIMSWDGFDTDDDTTVGNTISINTANAVSGVVVPYACTYVGAYFLGYQATAVSGVGRFQPWTGTPGNLTGSATTTVTLRTTDGIAANRQSNSIATGSVSIALNAGDVVYPAFQWVSGANSLWYGTLSLKFENISV